MNSESFRERIESMTGHGPFRLIAAFHSSHDERDTYIIVVRDEHRQVNAQFFGRAADEVSSAYGLFIAAANPL